MVQDDPNFKENAVEETDASAEAPKKKKKKKKSGTRTIETLYRSMYRVHVNLSAIADNKANIMISVNALMSSVIISAMWLIPPDFAWVRLVAGLVITTNIFAIIFGVLSARPRVNLENVDKEALMNGQQSVLFFGNFIALDEDEFITTMNDIAKNRDKILNNMNRDIYAMGKVLERKYRTLGIAYNGFLYGLSLAFIVFIVLYFFNV